MQGTAELIRVLPHQLGYQPRSSLVMVLLRDSGEDDMPTGVMGPVVRVDIPPPGASTALVRHLASIAHQHRAEALHLIAFEGPTDAAADLLRAIAHECQQRASVAVAGLARVRGSLWTEVAQTADHDAQWLRLPAYEDVAAVAHLVGYGKGRAPSREALCAPFEDTSITQEQTLVAKALEESQPIATEASWRQWTRAWTNGLQGESETSPTVIAQLVLSVRDLAYRDRLLDCLAPGANPCAPSESASEESSAWADLQRTVTQVGPEALTEALQRVVLQVPHSQRVGLLTCLAFVLWWNGDGTRANIAVAHARELDPDYRLAHLIDRILQAGMAPPGCGGSYGAA